MSHSPSRAPAPPGPVLSILGCSPNLTGGRGFTLSPPRGGQRQRGGQQPPSCLISPQCHRWSRWHLIFWRWRIRVLQPGRGTAKKAPWDGLVLLRTLSPVLSSHPNTPAAPGTRPWGRQSWQQLLRRAGSRAAPPADAGAVKTLRAFSRPRVPASRAAAQRRSPPVPEAGSRCPAPGLSGVRRALPRPAAQPARRAPDGPPARGPDAPAQRRKAIPSTAGSAGQMNPPTPPHPQPLHGQPSPLSLCGWCGTGSTAQQAAGRERGVLASPRLQGRPHGGKRQRVAGARAGQRPTAAIRGCRSDEAEEGAGWIRAAPAFAIP